MQRIDFGKVKIGNGFWKEKQKLISAVTVKAMYDAYSKSGHLATMSCNKNSGIKPHHFWGSDVFKWLEGIAYILKYEENTEILKLADEVIKEIEKGVREDGYYNTYFNVTDEEIFTKCKMHELYSLGHLIEAAVAFHGIGDDRLLKVAEKNTALVNKVFTEDKSAGFDTPGHEEIELALYKLYKCTGKNEYLELMKYFLDNRGVSEKDRKEIELEEAELHEMRTSEYTQSHLPVRRQYEAVGHAVRAVYLYSAMADMAKEENDVELEKACNALFDDIYGGKMYITGGIGQVPFAEEFAPKYYLPNREAYAETCAAIGFSLFCNRMLSMKADARFGDVIERNMYNGFLSGISLSGDRFFYKNPLEIDISTEAVPHIYHPESERPMSFSCGCCPPNIVRIIPSIGNFIYGYDEKYVYIHQYIESETEIDGEKVVVTSDYPYNGKVKVTAKRNVALRKPSWCEEVITESEYTVKDGYMYFRDNKVEVEFVMKPKFYMAASDVHADTGKVALTYGPFIYCAEEKDQEAKLHSLRVDPKSKIKILKSESDNLPTLSVSGEIIPTVDELYGVYKGEKHKTVIKYIPFYTFANRGRDNMLVWINEL